MLPNDDQLDAAARVSEERGVPLTAVVDEATAGHHGRVALTTADALARRERAPHGARAMCCHERGVYWVAWHRQAVGALNFDERCLRMLTKADASRELAAAGVTVLPKRRLRPGGEVPPAGEFPLVAKPNFGFASILVKRVPDPQALERYLQDFDRLRAQSMLEVYADFAREHIGPAAYDVVCEPDLSEQDSFFLTVPFLVQDGELRRLFPILGLDTRADRLTDFSWSRFHTGPTPPGAHEALARELELLVAGFGLSGGVYEIEALYAGGRAHVLEFSPRVTGGLIPELVRLATGVDLHTHGLLYFLGINEPLPPAGQPRRLGLRLRRSDEPPDTDAPVLMARERVLGGITFVDEVTESPTSAGDT